MIRKLNFALSAVALGAVLAACTRSDQPAQQVSDSVAGQPGAPQAPVAETAGTTATIPPRTDSAGPQPSPPRAGAPPVRPPGTAPATPAGSTDQATEALKQAATAYGAVRSMRADFTQWQDNPLLSRRTNSRGTVYQRQPDRFLMKFSQPAGDVIVSDGEYFWMYYPSSDSSQVLRTRAAAVGGLDLRAQFIGDPVRRFQFTDHGLEQVADRSARVLTLVPREPAGYRTLKVWIDERDHLVRRFELTTENGVIQHFDFSNLEINPTLSNDLFRFTPPPRVRIVDR